MLIPVEAVFYPFQYSVIFGLSFYRQVADRKVFMYGVSINIFYSITHDSVQSTPKHF